MKLGKANYGVRKKTFKLEDGDNIYRILPPMGDLADSGVWAKYYAVVWGYKNSEGKNKPFQDPSEKNRSNGMLEKVSAALERRLKLEEQKKKMKEAGASQEQMEKMNEILKQFNIEKKYYLNVINLKGEIGLLKVGYKVYKALTGDKKAGEKGLIDRLMDKGVDPVSSLNNGRYFNIHRQGKRLDTQYTVTVYQENVERDGEILQKEKVSIIDDNIINRLEKEAFDLSTLYPTPSLEEVARIVKEGPTAVDKILGKNNKTASEEMSEKEDVDTTSLKQETKTEVSAPQTENTTSGSASGGIAGGTTEQKTEAAQQFAEQTEPETTTPTAPKNDAFMDPNEFLASMGVDPTALK